MQKKLFLSFITLFFITTVLHSSQQQRPFILLTDPTLKKIEFSLHQYMPKVIHLIFEKWKFLMALTDPAWTDERSCAITFSVSVPLKKIALSEKNNTVLDPHTAAHYNQSFIAIKELLILYGISIKEAVKAQKTVKKVVTTLCQERHITDSLIYTWANTFPDFYEKEALKNISAVELYMLLNNLKEVFRDIVMNLQASHGNFKKIYLFAQEKDIPLFEQFVNGLGWSVTSAWD